jgi:hypothetical protein
VVTRLLLLLVCSAASAYDISYNMSLDQYKETRKLFNSFSFSQALSRSVSLNVETSFSADRSDDLSRFLDNRSGRAWISWQPIDRIELSSSFTRAIQNEDRFGRLVFNQLDNTATGDIRYVPAGWLSLSMSLGSHYLEYENVSGDSTISGDDQGGVRSASVSFNREILERLSSSLTFGENRTLGRQTDTGRDDLTARLSYSFPEGYDGGSLTAEAGAARMFTTYHDSSFSHREQNWRHSVTFTLPGILESVAMQVGTSWIYDNRYWENPEDTLGMGDPRDRLQRSRSLTGALRWDLMDQLSAEVSLDRYVDRNDRKRTSPGIDSLFDVYDVANDGVFEAVLTYTPGESRIVFQRGIELYSFDTEGTWIDGQGTEYEDNSDRDEVREVLTVDLETPLNPRLILLANVQGQRLETVYLKAEQSGNSKTTSTYAFTPGYEYDIGGDWSVRHTVRLSADYTTFRFPESSVSGSNLLFRRVDSQMTFQKLTSDSTALGISHRLRLADQGSYEGSLYGKAEKSLNNTITLNTGFHVGGVGITPSYSYEYSRRDNLSGFAPAVVEHLHHVGLRTRMDIGEGMLSLQITRTFYADERPSYWQANVGFNYLF